ncbi:gfo/Idh/MocA family oxidoreductase [Euzebyella marina]|uniref:Gfo/Idh/MocA family oxidoreductase n=1 Tax=Euzebyella marina TaxID=1761453 RepID=A0A3G2L3B3_9FLAO|nr:Gfo/Idh/MocA family oxidoreductase [Euzebyella marina]AYN66676.1 gfo/Idh/MocA family oxidoreductase [Euzebyella marina]
MVKVALIGAGKMGISHLSILGAHKDVEVVGVCDTSSIVLGALKKYTQFPCYKKVSKMLNEQRPDAAFVAVPTKYHYEMIKQLLNHEIHVFCEKPFCIEPAQSKELAKIAKEKGLINQVGYHNHFIGTFREVKKIVESGVLGEIYHFAGEAYGPVVTKKKDKTWRSKPDEGGGCLMDYAAHVIDLINNILAPIKKADGTILKSIYSENVDDAVYSVLQLENNISGVLSVNWSDETYRKMSTSISIWGTKGKITSNASELRLFVQDNTNLAGYEKGWNIKYITELASPVDFYLRGEEYSAQIDYFIKAIKNKGPHSINSFQSAVNTNNAISLIKTNHLTKL